MIKYLQKFIIFIVIAAWLFSGFPPIWHNPNIPPKIQEAKALTTDTYYGAYDTINGDMVDRVNAETDDTQYAYGVKNKYVVIEGWIGTAGSGEITGVRIYCQHYATTPDGNDYTLVDYSLDNWVGTGATTGQQVMSGSETSFSVDITADRSWTWADITNLEVMATAKASGKPNFTDDYIDVLYIQVDYNPPPAVSISLTTDGSVAFGTIAANTTRDTTTTDLNDPETISVDTGPADLDIRSAVFSDGGNTWSLSTVNGADQVKWEFSEDEVAWTTFAVADDLYTLDTNVAQGQTRNVYLRLTTPTSTSSYNEHSTTVTIVASAPP